MRNFIKTFAVFTCWVFASNTIAQSEAQSDFSMGLGGGSTHFYGSIPLNNNIGRLVQLDGRYKFNETFSTSLSFQYATLKASRLGDTGNTSGYFDSKTKNADIHFQIDVLSFGEETQTPRKLRIALDMGPGLMFYDEMAYIKNSNGELVPDYVHKDSHGTGTAYKVHLGGEIGYKVTDKLEIFGSILGNYIFSSEVDGYTHYNNKTSEATNDFYYTTTFGLRYDLWSNTPKNKRVTQPRTHNNDRWKGRKTVEQNKSKEVKNKNKRWEGRQNTEETINKEKSSKTERWEGRITE